MHVAAGADHVPIFRYIQIPKIGADFSVKDEDGRTFAMLACSNGHADVVKILHANVGADFSIMIDKGDLRPWRRSLRAPWRAETSQHLWHATMGMQMWGRSSPQASARTSRSRTKRAARLQCRHAQVGMQM